VITLISNSKLKYGIRYTFYIVMGIYWLRMAYLGVQLYHVKTLGQAQGLLESQSVFLVQIIKNYFVSSGNWVYFFRMFLRDLSIASLALCVIWWLDDVMRHEVEWMVGASLVVPMAALVAFLFIMSSGTVAKGFYYGNILGMVLMFVSLILLLTLIVSFILRMNKGDLYDREL
jgi:hypothetical protein